MSESDDEVLRKNKTVFAENNAQLPSLYEHYTSGGITSGLEAKPEGFFLNGKPYKIISGAIHYFRVHPAYWRDRLRKLRAAGITAVETYVAWNLHEPEQDNFDFGKGSGDMSIFLDLVTYIKIAQEEDLFVIFRPGPYICSEWDFGGLPSWLLRDYTMQFRSMYEPYLTRALNYLDNLIPLVTDLQFTSGGPIIAVQVENEFGAFGYNDHPRDTLYLQTLLQRMKDLGLKELFFTSDSPAYSLDWGAIPGVLQTANFQSGAANQFEALLTFQPNLPLMVTEFWSGWFDHWAQGYHDGSTLENFNQSLTEILGYGSSVNFYMFHGGTNFGFMNGANYQSGFPDYLPDVTSYDYDAPLSEAGDYTPKYDAASQQIMSALAVQTKLPVRPAESIKRAYSPISGVSYLTLNDLISQVPSSLVVQSANLMSMEELPINSANGQSYGFTVYRKNVNISPTSSLKVRNHIRDLAQLLVNGQIQTPPIKTKEDLRNFGSWYPRDSSFTFGSWKAVNAHFEKARADVVMDIVVENLGRVNYGVPHDYKQKKGLWEGPVYLDDVMLQDWTIIPLEFKKVWVNSLSGWRPLPTALEGPVAIKFTLTVDNPQDTFLDMSTWGKGVVFVNGFNLGRYWSTVGPQQTLYLPGPLLRTGDNTIIIYEQYTPAAQLIFRATPSLGRISFKEHL